MSFGSLCYRVNLSYGESSIFSFDLDLIETDSESSCSIIIFSDFYVALFAARLYDPNPAVANVLFC